MTHILAVANTMIEVSDFQISNLKLQKLLYYVYGVNLVVNPKEELSEGPQAWMYGPVFPTVYRAFREYEADIIPMTATIRYVIPDSKVTIDEGDFLGEIICSVYDEFGGLQNFELVRMTHEPGTPWNEYYGRGKRNIPMRNSIIEKFFQENVLARPRTR